MQTITRYKSMKIFKQHQLSFFNVYLLRFYLVDQKFAAIGTVFAQIINLRIKNFDFFLLNNLINEIKNEVDDSTEYKLYIYSVATMIADYFKNAEMLESFGRAFMNCLTKNSQNSGMDLLGDDPPSN